MNWREAMEQAVLGEKVRPVDLQPGAYLTHNFNGYQINFPNGSSSGYRNKAGDHEVEWEIYTPPQGWACFEAEPVVKPEPVKQGWNDYGN